MRQKEEAGRILTLEAVRKAGACAQGREAFRRQWGAKAVVNQAWAQEAAIHIPDQGWWAAQRLLPMWAYVIRERAMDDYVAVGGEAWNRISWAVFAALYVEAGKS